MAFFPKRISPLKTLVGAAALTLALSAQAVRYQGQDFPDTLELGGKTLVLSGIGERAAYGFHGYSAALYMTKVGRTPDEIYAVPGPKRLELRITLSIKSIDAAEFEKAIDKGVGRNCSEAEKAALGDRVQRLNANLHLVGSVKKGDVVLIEYLPERGTTLTVNGKVYGQPVPGGDLYTAFLKVFLGEKVSDERLRAGLLGQTTYKGAPV
ncbi:MAG: chalcone isomerase family protein [Pelomonas sp.]|nr:chalcone isomerase family protein [Roseateles sp.]